MTSFRNAIFILLCMVLSLMCGCTSTPDTAEVIAGADEGRTLSAEDMQTLTEYVQTAMTSAEAVTLARASDSLLRSHSPEATRRYNAAVNALERKWPLLKRAATLLTGGGAVLPMNLPPASAVDTISRINP